MSTTNIGAREPERVDDHEPVTPFAGPTEWAGVQEISDDPNCIKGWVAPPKPHNGDVFVQILKNGEQFGRLVLTEERGDVLEKRNRRGYAFSFNVFVEGNGQPGDEFAVQLPNGKSLALAKPFSIPEGEPVAAGEEIEEMAHAEQETIDAKLERTEARIEAAEARMEMKLAQAISETKLSNAELRSAFESFAAEVRTEFKTLPRTQTLALGAATFFLALLGAIAAVISFGEDRFDGGVQLTSASVEQAMEAKRLGEDNAAQLRALTEALQKVNKELERVNSADRTNPSP